MKYRHKIILGLWAAGIVSVPVIWAYTNFVQIQSRGAYRLMESNGIPDHSAGKFPNANNPNAISPQQYSFRVSKNPQLAGKTTPVHHDLFGAALNGVPFDPASGEFWDGDRSWNYEALSGKINLGLDQHHAHVQPNGSYHYHGIPTGFLDHAQKDPHGFLIGYAADGFPIYYQPGKRSSYQLKRGTRPSGPGGAYDGSFTQDYEYVPGSGDLDECGGQASNGNSSEGYRYYLTDQFPYVPRCFKGTPDPSFVKKVKHMGPSGREETNAGREAGRGRPRPPREAVDACQGSSESAACRFEGRFGPVQGTCQRIQGDLACKP